MFGVFLATGEGPGRRVGELDEEMVYESRVGDVFLLGSSSWLIEDITHDRVLVTPAPGQVGKMPFWKGDSPGRPAELGRALGAFVRELVAASPTDAQARSTAAGLDAWGTANLLTYLGEQTAATGHVPDDRTVVVERFRDELGDWRLVVHSPFGAPVNAPWSLILAARIRERTGLEVQAMHADDGIVLRLPETDGEPPSADLAVFEADDVERMVTAEVGGSALFASRFRECAARSLLLPKRDPRRRAPLWQQRQRANQLLQVAGEYGQFPVVLEAMRECLQDVFDVPGLRTIMADISARRVRIVEVQTDQPSPFARSLLFGYVGMFLYDGDAPLAERRAQALSLDSALLSDLLGSADLRDLLDADALAEVEREIQRLTENRSARGLDSVHDLLRGLGDLSTAEAHRRGCHGRGLGRAGDDAAGDPDPGGRCRTVAGHRGRGPGPRRPGRGVAGRRARSVHRAGSRSARRSDCSLRPHPRPVPCRRGGRAARAGCGRGDLDAGAAARHRAAGAGRVPTRRGRHRMV